MLDNVIDINYFSVPQAETSNFRHRPIGLGLMGFQDALYKIDAPYGSDSAVTFADRSMEAISYFAIEASSELASERGRYSSYGGSLWSRGIFPLDSLDMLIEQRGEKYIEVNKDKTLDWDLKAKVASAGMPQLQRDGDRAYGDY